MFRYHMRSLVISLCLHDFLNQAYAWFLKLLLSRSRYVCVSVGMGMSVCVPIPEL